MPSLSFVLHVLLIAGVHLTVAFDRDQCFKTTQALLSNHSLSPESTFFFRDNADSPFYNGIENMTLTLDGCNALCGPKQTWYTNIGPRLTVWLILVLLLLANVDLGPLGKRNYLTLLHLFGDPIDSMWSLLHKIDAWDRCYSLATRCTDEEVQGPRIKSERDFETLFDQFNVNTQFNEWRRAAVRMTDGRTNEFGRTILAFVLYIFQLICAFVPEIGGEPPGPPGGRIATGVLLSWLVPAILLTNAVGSLTSRRTAYSIIADLAASTEDRQLHILEQHSFFMPSRPSVAQVSSTDYSLSLAWSGGIYMFRPWKLRYVTSTRHPKLYTLVVATVAALPVLLGLIGGVIILWYQLPTGLNCRNVWLVLVALLWNVSALTTTLSNTFRFATGKYHWRFVLVKDACVTMPTVLIMFLSAVGSFNSCWCWSGPFQYAGKGRVPLPETVYLANARSVYPTVVGLSLMAQILVVTFVMVWYRKGLRLLRWRAKTSEGVWNCATTGSGGVMCDCVRFGGGRGRWNAHLGLGSEAPLLKVTTKSRTNSAIWTEGSSVGD